MESGNSSTHQKPHILPPLGIPKLSNESGKIGHQNSNVDKPVRQRIGTPAPQKKSPIPDDLDLDNLNGKRGNPTIKVESCKLDEMQKNHHHILPEKMLRSLPDDVHAAGNNNVNSRLPKKQQLQPIMSPIVNVKNQGDLNGNDIIRRHTSDFKNKSPDVPPPAKIHLPKKYTPLKPIARKKSNSD